MPGRGARGSRATSGDGTVVNGGGYGGRGELPLAWVRQLSEYKTIAGCQYKTKLSYIGANIGTDIRHGRLYVFRLGAEDFVTKEF